MTSIIEVATAIAECQYYHAASYCPREKNLLYDSRLLPSAVLPGLNHSYCTDVYTGGAV